MARSSGVAGGGRRARALVALGLLGAVAGVALATRRPGRGSGSGSGGGARTVAKCLARWADAQGSDARERARLLDDLEEGRALTVDLYPLAQYGATS